MTGEKQQDESSESEKPKRVDVSVPQVAGGALASVTAALLGSQLGAVGTFWGAGLTSVVITVGGALYQRSLERTQENAKVASAKAALKRAAKPGPIRTGQEAERDAATRRIRPNTEMHWPGGERVHEPAQLDADRTARVGDADRTRMLGEDELAADRIHRPVTVPKAALRRRRGWGVAAVSGALMFGLCMLVITGFEGVTNRPLSGDGTGTTIGRAFHGPATPEPPPDPGPAPVPEETASEVPGPSTESSTSPESTPTESEPDVAPTRTEQPTRSPESTGEQGESSREPLREPSRTSGFEPQSSNTQ